MPSSDKSEKTAQGKKADKESKNSSPLDPLKQAYFSVEDKYYELMDYLEDKVRVPVYEYFVEPIEKNGIPSFPIGVLVVLLVGLGIFMVATGAGQTGTVSISLLSASGQAIDGATVTLYVGDSTNGDILGTSTSSDGKATFSGVPLGKQLYVTVSATNFKEYSDSLGEVTAGTPTIKISMEDVEKQPDVYRLTVVDEDGLPIAGAMVKAKSLAGVQIGVYNTDAKGISKIQLPSTDSLLVTITRTGFSNATDFGIDPKIGLLQTVTLKKSDSDCANGACDKKTTVIVKVINSQQQPVQAQVVLTSSLGSVLGTASTSGGQAAIANVPVGTKAIVSISSSGADLGKYNPYYYYDYLVASDENVITATMAASTSSGLSPIFVSVADESGKPLAAEVNLYSERSDTLLGKAVARNGDTNFSTDNISSYATAYLAGYLPKAVSGLKPGSREKLVLKKILAGTAGSFEVQVVDADGSTPVAQATLTVRSSDGRNAGYPAVRTNADGAATIGNVSLGVDYAVYADKSPKTGKSALYRAYEGDATKITVKMNPTTAKVVVSTRDAVNDTGIYATVTAYGADMANTSCTTSYSNSYACELTVRAESNVYIHTAASYYETLVSPAMVLSTGDSKAYTAYLLQSAFKDQFFVKFAGLFDEKGNNVTLVDKGRQYDAKFIVNVPSGSASSRMGFMVRAGTVGKDSLAATDSKEKFAILSDGTTTASTDPVFAASYVPSTSCSNDRKSNSEVGYFKWVAFSFANESGSREITVRILSKTDAASSDKLQINYNGWYSAGGSASDTYLRSPEDSTFGSALRSASLDYCYAASNKAVFSVANGRSTCTSSACISLDFSDGTANYGPSYLGEVNSPLVAKVEVRLLKAVESPRIYVGSDNGNMQIRNYSIVTDSESKVLDSSAKAISNVTVQLLPFSDPASLSFYMLPVVPVTSGAFTIRFYDGQTALVSATGYVTLEGEGKMKIVYVKPDRINASQYSDLSIKVADANSGNAITDATVSINETTGSPFDGSVPEPMTGSSVFSSGQGYNGIYTFSDVYPTANGVFEVIVEQPNYATVRQNVSVNSDDFLSVTPLDLDVCGKTDERSIKIRNSLPLNVSIVASSSCAIMSSYVYSQTAYDETSVPTSYYNATSYVAYDSFSQSYKFTLPESRLGIFTVRPAAYGKDCSITFNAEGRDKSRDVQTVKYTTCAADSADKFLSVTPSKVVCTSEEGNCDTSATITVANNLSSDVEGTVSVTIKGTGLVLDSSSALAGAKPGASLAGTGLVAGKTASFDGTLVSLDSGYTFEMARGASTDFTVVPASTNKTLQLLVTAVAGPRKASTTVEIKNCPGTIDPVGPKIVSSYPVSGAVITYQPFNILLTTDKPAVCKLDNLYTFPSGTNSQVHTMAMSLNAGTDTAPLSEGMNVFSATCCNLAENGGKCGTGATVITFNFTVKNATTKANGESCEDDDECESGNCNSTDMCQKASTELCGPLGIVCPDSCESTVKEGDSCKDSLSECCESGTDCISNVCTKTTSNGLGSTCDYYAQNCNNPLTCREKPDDSSKDLCTCNYAHKDDRTLNGCPSDTPVCVQISNMQFGTCVSTSQASNPPVGCYGCIICNSAGTGCAAIPSATPTATATASPAPTGSPVPTATVSPSATPTVTVTPGASSSVVYSLKDKKFYDSTGTTELARYDGCGLLQSCSKKNLGLSPLLPVSGLILEVRNDLGDGSTAKGVTFASLYATLTNMDGTSVTSQDIPKDGSIYVLVTYPPKADVKDMMKTDSSSSWVYLSSTHSTDSYVQIGFNWGSAYLYLVPDFDTSSAKYAFGVGLYDKTDDMFVPFDSDGNAQFAYDTAYTSRTLDKSIYVFSNLLVGKDTMFFRVKTQNSGPLGLYEGTWVNLTPGYIASAAGDANPGVFSYDKIQVKACSTPSSCANENDNLDPLKAVLHPFDSSGIALTHEKMAEEVNAALAELRNLDASCTAYNTKKKTAFNALDLLKLGAVGSTGKRVLPDLYVTANEGGALRVLWFHYDPTAMGYAVPKDITGTFEYPLAAGDSDTRIALPMAGSASSSRPLYLFAYPGQKANTAYDCDLGLTDGTVCSSKCTGSQIYRNSGSYRLINDAEQTIVAGYSTCSEKDVTDKYLNAVSGIVERNPRLCCSSGVSSSDDGACLPLKPDCYLSAAVSTSSTSACPHSSPCDSAGTDAAKCSDANYVSGTNNGLFLYNVYLNPANKCIVPSTGGACTACGLDATCYAAVKTLSAGLTCAQTAVSAPAATPTVSSASPTPAAASTANGAKPGVSVRPFLSGSCAVDAVGSKAGITTDADLASVQISCYPVTGAENCLAKYTASFPDSATIPTTNYVCASQNRIYSGQCYSCNAATEACIVTGSLPGDYYCTAFCKTDSQCASNDCTNPHESATGKYGICNR
ncbi:MAG: carboxypeptidase-like regulatory domain-containing protein [Candidatus Micrarchaeia archaeon]